MAAILVPVCLLAAWNDLTPVVDESLTDDEAADAAHALAVRNKRYFALMLVLEAFIVGVFAATDVFLFYVFFEAMLIPVYFLIGLFGGARRQYAAVKFLLFSLAGGLIMLVAVIAVYVAGPGGDDGFLISQPHRQPRRVDRRRCAGCSSASSSPSPSRRRCGRCTPGCPDAATEARPATAVLLVGILDKVGTYGMIRFCLQLFPEACAVGDAGRHHAGRHLDHLRRAAGHRPDRHDAADRLHLDQPLRPHRARHLRAHQRRWRRVDALHGQPRLLDRRPVPHRRRSSSPAAARSASPTTAAGSGSPRCSPAPSSWPACRAWRCRACRRSCRSSSCCRAPSCATRPPPSSRPSAPSWPRSTSC